MALTRAQSISTALRRIRRSVLVCCWLVGLALAAQTTVWSLSMFTDIRYDGSPPPAIVAPTIVKSDDGARKSVRAMSGNQAEQVAEATEVLKTQKRYSLYEGRFATVVAFATTVGTMAMLALIPLLMTGVLLAAGAGVMGVQKAVSAMQWWACVALLALPLSGIFPLIQYDGAFYSYSDIISSIETNRAGESLTGTPVFLLRYLVLPLTCVIGLVMVGIRFTGGVESALVPHEMALDPALEQEVSKIRPSSLHGGAGRSANALRGAVSKDMQPLAGAVGQASPSAPPPSIPRATQVSPGTAPRRLI